MQGVAVIITALRVRHFKNYGASRFQKNYIKTIACSHAAFEEFRMSVLLDYKNPAVKNTGHANTSVKFVVYDRSKFMIRINQRLF